MLRPSDGSHTHIEFVKNEILETLGRLDVMPSVSGKTKESSPLVQTALFYKRHDTVSRGESLPTRCVCDMVSLHELEVCVTPI